MKVRAVLADATVVIGALHVSRGSMNKEGHGVKSNRFNIVSRQMMERDWKIIKTPSKC